jgi:hypothetical protein
MGEYYGGNGVMGAYAGPEVVESGLVLALDAANSKSYPGSGTTWTDLSGSNNTGTPPYLSAVEVLVVAGGGGGGMDMGGGGGGGGVIYSSAFSITPGSAIAVTVGNGGVGAPAAGTNGQPGAHQYTIPATQGGNSVFGALTAIGGGFGGSSYRGYTPGIAGGSGGSGGGASGYNDNAGTFLGGLGTSGQGNRGGNSTAAYYSGGGGGAGAPGADSTNQPNGGVGVENSILGVSYFWGGGGGGASYSLSTGGNGGNGGGGGGAVGTTVGGSGLNPGSPGGGGSPNSQTNTPGGNAGANTGGGGGGGSHYNSNNKGGNGGSGIVIVRYPGSQRATGGTVTSVAGDTIHTFTTSGTFTPNGGNNGTIIGATYSSANGGAFTYGASSITTVPIINLRPTTAITQECWFLTTNNTAQVFIGSQYESSTNNSYALWLNAANQWAAGVNIGGSFNLQTYNSTVSTNVWYHYVHTYDGANQRMYINGSQVHSWATTGLIVYDTNNTLLAVGNDWNSGYNGGASVGVQGRLAKVSIYNRALTASEIQQNYNALRSRFSI